MKDKIQKLMDMTSIPEYIGQTVETIGWSHKRFIVTKVQRVENDLLWKKYSIQRDLMSSRSNKSQEINPKIETNNEEWGMDLNHLESRVNESYLFHGTSKYVSEIIRFQGFDERVANLQGYFGGGVYFAQNCSKSDEYCGQPPQSDCLMFLSRVLLGNGYVSLQVQKGLRRPPLMKINNSDGSERNGNELYDCVIGEIKKNNLEAFLPHYREFIVYDKNQAYPEFLISYTRSK